MDESLNLLDGLEDLEIPTEPHQGATQLTSDSDRNAHFFGTYQLIQQVGEGGVAKVFLARHIHPGYADKSFAIKILHQELSRDPQVVDLFRHEAYVLSLLKHPNIVETFEAGNQDEKLFIAMEYIDGHDLDNLMVRCSKLRLTVPVPVAMHIVGETLKALSYAHDLADADDQRLNLVHRDVNPSNVLMSYDGRVKLGDFGVASIAAGALQKERRLAGKAGYFAPEQLEGKPIDQRADLFSLGVMIFELLCSVRLFQADTTEALIRLNKRAKIPKPTKFNPNISPPLEQVILRALSKKPMERYRDAREMYQGLLPFIPKPAGMPLAVAALMRKVFLNEHIRELQLHDGLSGGKINRGSGQLVAVCTGDERAQAAFNELLMSRGYRVDVHSAVETLGDSFVATPANALLIDVCSDGFHSARCIAQLARAPQPIPVVAVSEALEPDSIRKAESIGAVDLLFKPFNIERVLTSVRAAIAGAVRVASIETVMAVDEDLVRPSCLVLSSDMELVSRLSDGLTSRGYDVEVSPTTAEALERTNHASYHAVVFDAHPASPSDRFFAGEFRGRPGMGLVPILYLADPESHSIFAGVDADRSAVRPRTDPPAVLVETLKRLRGDTRLGRTFIRVATQFPVEIRYGGRVFSGEAVDISRGGVMVIFAEQMPPVGTGVGLRMRLPSSNTPVEAKGRVARVDLLPSSHSSKVGVEFETFGGRGATALIAFLATLDSSKGDRRSTMIIGTTPKS